MRTQYENQELIMRMISFDQGDPKRIQHFIKVYQFAHLIGAAEGLRESELRLLDAAAILHDIGIIPSEKKYGVCNGKLQEQEGPVYARTLLEEQGGYDEKEMERICYLIGHHHTYSNVDGIDYQILIEADFLVNAWEDHLPLEKIRNVRKSIFRTETGLHLLDTMFAEKNEN